MPQKMRLVDDGTLERQEVLEEVGIGEFGHVKSTRAPTRALEEHCQKTLAAVGAFHLQCSSVLLLL